jgi:hypothetical protein
MSFNTCHQGQEIWDMASTRTYKGFLLLLVTDIVSVLPLKKMTLRTTRMVIPGIGVMVIIAAPPMNRMKGAMSLMKYPPLQSILLLNLTNLI